MTREELLAKADIYRFLSWAFTFPDKDMIESLLSLIDDMEEVVNFLPYNMNGSFLLLKKRLEGPDIEALKSEYSELFLTRMICSPYETSYGRRNFNKPNIMADISGFYRAFGFSLSKDAPVMHDHISAEFEFMGILALKEAYAIEQGMEENLNICLSAGKKFLGEHLGSWVGLFCRNLRERTTKDYYRDLAVLTERFMEGELISQGIKIDTKGIVELPKEDDTISCPMELKAGGEEEPSLPIQ